MRNSDFVLFLLTFVVAAPLVFIASYLRPASQSTGDAILWALLGGAISAFAYAVAAAILRRTR